MLGPAGHRRPSRSDPGLEAVTDRYLTHPAVTGTRGAQAARSCQTARCFPAIASSTLTTEYEEHEALERTLTAAIRPVCSEGLPAMSLDKAERASSGPQGTAWTEARPGWSTADEHAPIRPKWPSSHRVIVMLASTRPGRRVPPCMADRAVSCLPCRSPPAASWPTGPTGLNREQVAHHVRPAEMIVEPLLVLVGRRVGMLCPSVRVRGRRATSTNSQDPGRCHWVGSAGQPGRGGGAGGDDTRPMGDGDRGTARTK